MDWLDYIFNLVAIVASLVAVFEGTQLLTLKGKTRRAVVTLIVGVTTSSSLVAINYIKFHIFTDMLVTLSSSKSKTHPREESSTLLTKKQIEDIALEIARDEYFHTGTIITYETQNNISQQFSPTQTEIREREKYVSNITEIHLLAKARWNSAISLILWTILAAMFGYYSGRKLRQER